MLKSSLSLASFFVTLLTVVACGGGTAANTANPPGSGAAGSGPGGSDPGGAGGVYYLPFVATSSSGGETGLFVVPSDNLSAPPIFVTRTPTSSQTVLVEALSKQLASNSSNMAASASPYALLYAAAGGDGSVHLYALTLSNTSVAPSATQVSSLALSSTDDICPANAAAQTKLTDPTTLFVVLHTNPGGTSSCGHGGDVYQVIHYTDSATTAPSVVQIAPAGGLVGNVFTALYRQDGSLGGLVLLDSATGALQFYSDNTFTNPVTTATGGTSWSDLIDDSSVDNTAGMGAQTAFLAVTTSSGTALWRVTASGVASKVYTASGSLGLFSAADNSNVYFTDWVEQRGAQSIYQESIGGGAPIALYSTTAGSLPPAPPYTVVGSTGVVLVLATEGPSSSIVTLPVGKPATPTRIAGPFSGAAVPTLCPATSGDVSSDVLLVNVIATTSAGATTTATSSTEILTPAGVVEQPVLNDSAFVAAPGCGFGSVLQVRGITDTTGGYGGGTVSALNLGSFVATQLATTSGNGSYPVPAGDFLGATFLTNTVGLGAVIPVAGGASGGVAVDLAKNLLVPVSVAGSNVSLELPWISVGAGHSLSPPPVIIPPPPQ